MPPQRGFQKKKACHTYIRPLILNMTIMNRLLLNKAEAQFTLILEQ